MNANTTPGQRVNIALLGCGSVCSIYHAPALEQLEQSGDRRCRHFRSDAEATRLTGAFPARRLNSAAYRAWIWRSWRPGISCPTNH